MYPYTPPEIILRHLAEQSERDRRSPSQTRGRRNTKGRRS